MEPAGGVEPGAEQDAEEWPEVLMEPDESDVDDEELAGLLGGCSAMPMETSTESGGQSTESLHTGLTSDLETKWGISEEDPGTQAATPEKPPQATTEGTPPPTHPESPLQTEPSEVVVVDDERASPPCKKQKFSENEAAQKYARIAYLRPGLLLNPAQS